MKNKLLSKYISLLNGMKWFGATQQLIILGTTTISFLIAHLILAPPEHFWTTELFIVHMGLLISLILLLRYATCKELGSRYDSLTKLSGRVHFLQRLDNRLNINGTIVLLIMDLNRFKLVNDTLGHAAGDDLLVMVSDKFREHITEKDLLARLGGDEFAVIFNTEKLLAHDSDLEKAVEKVCRRIIKSFDDQMVVRGYEVDVGVSIGASIFPNHAKTTSELLRCADVAMYAAKKKNKGYFLYNSSKDYNNPENLRLIGSIRTAIELNQFVLQYQPQKCIKTGKILSVEALIRWNHPTMGVLPPDKFIPMCEQTIVMKEITGWVVRTAVAQASKWRSVGIDLMISINISTNDLNTFNFVPNMVEALVNNGQHAADFTMEITETSVLDDIDASVAVMATLSNLGINFSIDDYGTGHTSLDYLKHLPINEIKIDRSFITNILTNSRDYRIVQSTIELAHDLHYKVVAEGVETKEVYDVLVSLGCDVIQGWYIARPCSPDRITGEYLSRLETLTSLLKETL